MPPMSAQSPRSSAIGPASHGAPKKAAAPSTSAAGFARRARRAAAPASALCKSSANSGPVHIGRKR